MRYRLASLAPAVILLAACTSVSAGHPSRDPTVAPNSDGAIVALLDHANYPTKPSAPLGNAGEWGRLIESQRLAEFVVLPSDVDKTITDQGNLDGVGTALPFATASSVGGLVVPGAEPILTAHGYIAGFAAERRADVVGHGKAMTVMVMRFPDPAAAADAATQLAAMPPPAGGARVPIPVPRHPDTRASTFDTGDGTNSHVVESYTSHGPYVLYQFVNAQENLDVAASITATALDLQGPRIDAFTPTDPAQLAALPIDPTGLYAATLHPDWDKGQFNNGVYGAQGGLAYEPNTLDMGDIFAATGVDAVAVGTAIVYQTKDQSSAQRFVTAVTGDADKDTAIKSVPPVTGLPASRCFDIGKSDDPGSSGYQCVASAGRYAFRVFSKQEIAARQQTAAQYLILLAKP